MEQPRPVAFLERWSVAALAVLVAAAYVPAALMLAPTRAAATLATGVLFLVATLGGAHLLERRPTRRVRLLVFGAQLLLDLVSALVSEGRTLLAPFATVSLAVLYLPGRPAALVLGLVAGLEGILLWAYASSATEAVQAIVAVGAWGTFVYAFSRLALARHRARQALAEAHARLRAQTEGLAALAAEEERLRIAREIHDSVGHWLTSAHVHLETAKAVFGDAHPVGTRALESAARANREALAEVRLAVRALRTPTSLVGALEELVEDAIGSGLDASLRVQDEGRSLHPAVQLALLRVAQEALTNVRRHAGARTLEVALLGSGDRVRLEVADDGRGLSDEALPGGPRPDGSGLGLRGLAERLRGLGGELTVCSAPGHGTRLSAEVPR